MTKSELTLLVVILLIIVNGSLTNFIDFLPISVRREKSLNNPRLAIDYLVPDFIGIVNQFGYPGEEHSVTTPDGYVLCIHRIPGSSKHPKKLGKPVVFIQHGILASSDSFVLAGPDHDLAYMLADNGYDVWLGNVRGNSYSRSHVQLLPNRDPQFWRFSFHEAGLYDLSSMIDYVLKQTNQRSLVYVAHSMGTSMGFVLLSSRPEYNKKIYQIINLATIGNWKNPKNLMRFFKYHGQHVKNFLTSIGINEVLPQTVIGAKIFNVTCSDGKILHHVCARLLQFISGYNPDEFDANLLARAFTYFPAGTSVQTLTHFYQNIVAGKFQMYDYGLIQNLAIYQERNPPEYKLENIVTPVYMFYGMGDAVATPEDTLELLAILKNAVAERVPHNKFTHLDFIWAKNVRTLLQNRVIDVINLSKKSAILRGDL